MSRRRRANGGGGSAAQRDWLAPGGGGAARGTAPAIHALVRSRAPPAPRPPGRCRRQRGTPGSRRRPHPEPEPGGRRRPAATAAQPRPRPLPAPSSPWRNARTGTGPPPVPPSHCASGAAGTGSPRPQHGDGCAEVTPSPRAALAWGSSCGRSCSGAKREPGVTSLFKTPHSSYRFFFFFFNAPATIGLVQTGVSTLNPRRVRNAASLQPIN